MRRLRPAPFVCALLCIPFFGLLARELYTKGSFQATKKMHASAKGCSCHSKDISKDVSVWIEGPQNLHPGENAVYTIYVAAKNNVGAGFNVASAHGELKSSESGVVAQMGEVAQSKTKLKIASDTIKWFFNYTAPLVNTITDTLFTAGLVSDDNEKISNDRWNYGNDFIIAIGGSVVDPDATETEELFQASLFQRETTTSPILDLEMSITDVAKVDVYTTDGKFVMNIKNEKLTKGEHVFPIPYGGLEGGIYYCRITVRDQNDAIKFLIVK